MKGKHVALLIILILIADQALKFYIKLNYTLGEEHKVIGNWFRLHFVENEGMAWGLKFGGGLGKILLTLFRLVAVIFGTYYLSQVIKKKYHRGFIICAALIYAGAFGNLIDSLFYGLIFSSSNPFTVATLFPAGGGYASFFHGQVVDMLYFPIIDTTYPSWFPIASWRGQEFLFFSPVFNLADSSISIGVIALLIWQKKFFPQHKHSEEPIKTSPAEIDDRVKTM
ncbi:lipoprotein signal peptidase [Parafilimonas sp.]|uniref:lipoprotein signal peptidase n=1 Tax=Parafilimonas sp. TaxID=1969739 RepID=UPI003F802273